MHIYVCVYYLILTKMVFRTLLAFSAIYEKFEQCSKFFLNFFCEFGLLFVKHITVQENFQQSF